MPIREFDWVTGVFSAWDPAEWPTAREYKDNAATIPFVADVGGAGPDEFVGQMSNASSATDTYWRRENIENARYQWRVEVPMYAPMVPSGKVGVFRYRLYLRGQWDGTRSEPTDGYFIEVIHERLAGDVMLPGAAHLYRREGGTDTWLHTFAVTVPGTGGYPAGEVTYSLGAKFDGTVEAGAWLTAGGTPDQAEFSYVDAAPLGPGAFILELWTNISGVAMSGHLNGYLHDDYDAAILAARAATFDLQAAPRPPALLGPVAATPPTYAMVVVARTPQAAGPPLYSEVGPLFFERLSWAEELNAPSEVTVAVPPQTVTPEIKARLRNPLELPSELWLYRDGELLVQGPLISGTVQNRTLTLHGRDRLYYTRYMTLAADYAPRAVDQFAIVAQYIAQWQAQAYGHFGIDTDAIGTSGQVRDRTHTRDEQQNVWTLIEQMLDNEDGFDIAVLPSTTVAGSGALTGYYPQQGSDLSAAVHFDARNLTTLAATFSVAAGDVASEGYGTSTGTNQPDKMLSTQGIAATRQSFGRTSVTGTWSNIVEQATLDAHVREMLRSRQDLLYQPSIEMFPVPDARVGDFGKGDTISYSYDDGLGYLELARRVARRQITLGAGGHEKIAVAFE